MKRKGSNVIEEARKFERAKPLSKKNLMKSFYKPGPIILVIGTWLIYNFLFYEDNAVQFLLLLAFIQANFEILKMKLLGSDYSENIGYQFGLKEANQKNNIKVDDLNAN